MAGYTRPRGGSKPKSNMRAFREANPLVGQPEIVSSQRARLGWRFTGAQSRYAANLHGKRLRGSLGMECRQRSGRYCRDTPFDARLRWDIYDIYRDRSNSYIRSE